MTVKSPPPSLRCFSFLCLLFIVLVTHFLFPCSAIPIGEGWVDEGLVLSNDPLHLIDQSEFSPSSQNSSTDSVRKSLSERDDCPVDTLGCCFSCCPLDSLPPNSPFLSNIDRRKAELQPSWICTGRGYPPSLDELGRLIRNKGTYRKTSLFYPRLGSKPHPIDVAFEYFFCKHPELIKLEADIVYYNDILDEGYSKAQSNVIAQFWARYGSDTVNRWLDRYQKMVSQAFAESSTGTVYVLLPWDASATGANSPEENTWKNWEYPALTRNKAVEHIMRVDPRPDSERKNGLGEVQSAGPHLIWKKRDPESPNVPIGNNWYKLGGNLGPQRLG